MTNDTTRDAASRLRAALAAPDGSTRVQAALGAGTYPDAAYIPVLVERCAREYDPHVREMLTWALIRQEREAALSALLPELRSPIPRARRQALHTLSKLGDARAWPSITRALLHDSDRDVARVAWRAAAILAPDDERTALADQLAEHLGVGGPDLQSSLTRAFLALGDAARPIIERATRSTDAATRAHAEVVARVLDDPDAEVAMRGRPDQR